jgi:hypothetical protein
MKAPKSNTAWIIGYSNYIRIYVWTFIIDYRTYCIKGQRKIRFAGHMWLPAFNMNADFIPARTENKLENN